MQVQPIIYNNDKVVNPPPGYPFYIVLMPYNVCEMPLFFPLSTRMVR